jgi:phage-related protein/predicted XRE-type DNA-binding protein
VQTPSAIPVVFYRTVQGGEPIREWLRTLPAEDRRKIGRDLALVQYGWPVGMPLCRALGAGLWEVRSDLPSRRTARILFFVHEGRIGVVHGFVKKDAADAARRSRARAPAHEGHDFMTAKSENPHWGSTLDDFLEEEGIREEATTAAIKRVIAWQLAEEMKKQRLTKKRLAELMHTSRAQIDRILDPDKGNVTIETLQRAAALLGRQLRLELV